MRGQNLALAVVVAAAALVLLALLVGLWPAPAPAPSQRADLRPQLERRHAAAKSASHEQAPAPAAPQPAQVLDTWVLCEQPRAGRVALLQGERLLVPCADGATLWALEGPRPEPELRLGLGAEGLQLQAALAGDLDGDGSQDLAFALRAGDPTQAYRQGLYWARGRRAGGFEEVARIAPAAVDAVVAARGVDGRPGELWLAIHEPEPAARPLLWRVAMGPAPTRTGQWELPAPASNLLLDPFATGEPSIAGLSGGVLWNKARAQDAPVERWTEIEAASRLWRVGQQVLVGGPFGLRAVSREADGSFQVGPAHGPPGVESVVVAGDGSHVAVADGTLWSWSGQGAPAAFGGAGGARVERLMGHGRDAFMWLSGLGGAQAVGVARLPAQWPPQGPIELSEHTVAGRAPRAELQVP